MECAKGKHTRMRWFMFIDPISTINVFQLHLKLKDKKMQERFARYR